MTAGFYLPLDSVINSIPNIPNTMASSHVHHSEPHPSKHDAVDVKVAEVDPDSPQAEFDSIMQSPRINMGPDFELPLNGHHGHHGHHHGHLRPSSPTGSVRSSFGGSRRRVTRHSSHFSSGFSRSHHSEVSKELTIQAEGEFLALMELMSSMSRRSTSLREVWMKIISERESHCHEMERMYERFEEFTEIIERHEKEQHNHNHDHEERKKEVTKLRLELTAAVALSAEFKRKLSDRDCELGKAHSEIAELKDVYKYLKEEHEETKTSLEETQLKLSASIDRCHHAEEDVKRHHGELEASETRYSELESSHTELQTRFKSVNTEVTTLRTSNSVYKKEKHEWLHEKGELEDEVRKCKHRHEETTRKIKELTETYEKKTLELNETIEKKTREVHETSETLRKVKSEREELYQKIKEKDHEIEEKRCRWEDAEDRCSKYKLKWEHFERETRSLTEELTVIKTERTELEETITKKTEEHRKLLIIKKQLEKDHHGKCKELDDHHREIIVLKESLRRTEVTIKEKTELIHTLHERIERVERDRDEARGQCADHQAEITTLAAAIVTLKLDIETVTAERESFCEKFRDCETKYLEVCESSAEYHEGNSSFEYEITSLRSMLREVREEREKAITMRIAADRERDEAVSRYEAKCREMDKLEERRFHEHERFHGHGGRSSSGRTLTRRVFTGSSNGIAEDDELRSVTSGHAE